jgi:large subunit ribosomal protein L17
MVEGKVVTTLAKAKELRRFAERAITLARRGLATGSAVETLNYRRLAASYFIGGHAQIKHRYHKNEAVKTTGRTAGVKALKKLFDEIGPQYAGRPGGYTRIIKLGWRKGDGAPLAKIELVKAEEKK